MPSNTQKDRRSEGRQNGHPLSTSENSAPEALRHSLPLDRTPPPSESKEDCDIDDFLVSDAYIADEVIDFRCSFVITYFLQLGPVFLNNDGESVSFNDLDWTVQCGMVDQAVRPILDQAHFANGMAELREDAVSQARTHRPAPAPVPRQPPSIPHERIEYSEFPPMVVARRVVGVWNNWHSSKTRLSHSEHLLGELGVKAVVVRQPRLLALGMLDSTLAMRPVLVNFPRR